MVYVQNAVIYFAAFLVKFNVDLLARLSPIAIIISYEKEHSKTLLQRGFNYTCENICENYLLNAEISIIPGLLNALW
jgi:hypothetical protein